MCCTLARPLAHGGTSSAISGNIFISRQCSGALSSVGPRGVDALQRNNEVKDEVRRHIVVWLTSTRRANRLCIHCHCTGGSCVIGRCLLSTGPHGLGPQQGTIAVARGSSYTVGVVVVRRHFGLQQGYGVRATGLAEIMKGQSWALAGVHGRIALQIGQRKGTFAIASVSRSKKRSEERRVGKECR